MFKLTLFERQWNKMSKTVIEWKHEPSDINVVPET